MKRKALTRLGVGELDPGETLDRLVGNRWIWIYRWIPSYADLDLRPGDYVLLHPTEGKHYGGRNAKRITKRVRAKELEHRQGGEYKWVP